MTAWGMELRIAASPSRVGQVQMSKILALGTGPLLESGVRSFSAHCLRTWHLVKPLLDAGHEIALFTIPIYTDRPETQIEPRTDEKQFEGLRYHAFNNCDDRFNLARLNEAAASFRPDALLGINSYPCALLSKVQSIVPMWADLNGSVVVEGQIKAAVYGNNSMLGFYWNMEETPLRRADKFSAVSVRQQYALLGELGSVGRMNRHTFAYPFATHIPNAFNPHFADPAGREGGKLNLRGKIVPQEAFILLWSGSYNSWTNIEILLSGVEQAMRVCPNLHYVSTGGPIHGHDDLTYPRFKQMARSGEFKERFHLLGWIDAAELLPLYAQADLGLCVDSGNYETMFGARNRTINMMAAGLPVLTTTGAEISEELVRAGCARGCKVDDAEDLARAIKDAYDYRSDLPSLGAKGREYVLDHFTYEQTTRELIAWAAKPEFAPDNKVKIERATAGINPFAVPTNPIEENRAKLETPPPSTNGSANGSTHPLKQAVEQIIGTERYDKLRFLRRHWWPEYRPRYLERRAEIKNGRMGKLEDLYIFLTNQCNARCKHCFFIDELGFVPGELTLADYEKLAPTIPPLKKITLTGGEAILHPQCREIIEVLGRETRAERLTLISNGFLPGKLEALCAGILEDARIPGILDILISLDGLEETHNTIRGNPRSWLFANHSLELLRGLKDKYPHRFDFGVITIINDKNYTQLEMLNDHLQKHIRCRHGFEFLRGSEFSVWGLPEEVRTDYNPEGVSLPPEEKWDEILESLRRINRRSGIGNHAFHLTNDFTVRMLKTKKRIMDCVSAGQNVGVLYSVGDIAMCEFSKPVGNVRDYGMDFTKVWNSDKANEMRGKLQSCHCTHGCYLSKNIEYSLQGQMAMLTRL